MKDETTVRIGTRGSPLALAQANMIAGELSTQSNGALSPEIVTITTSGDRIQDRRLLEAGGKGLFTKELDTALDAGEVDILVHSLKDVPVELPPGQAILAFPPREDPREAFISPHARHPNDLKGGAHVGTASLRRQAQTLALRPDLQVDSLRGNVGTRLKKLDAGEADATYLAYAGLRRLGMADTATAILSIDEMLPAAGQGIVAVAAKPDQLSLPARSALASIDDLPTRLAATAERAFLHALDGSCRTAMAAHFWPGPWNRWWMRGEVFSPDGKRRWQASGSLYRGMAGSAPSLAEAEQLGREIAASISQQAGGDLPKYETE